ncbi:aldo/keto reductase [Sulfolobales archaeon HS-7]|nr:aldo/keto reductase [Sulfolobales archaeon HS-7]
MEIGRIGFGTWGIGGGYWKADYTKDKEEIEAMKYWLSKGIRTIDTAEMYGGGHTEELVGEAIKREVRDDVFIISKVWSNHLHYEDLIKSGKASAKRVGTFLDLYLIHWPNDQVPLCESIRALETLVESGIARHIGVSNFDVPHLREALSCTRKYEIFANEIKYNYFYREPEKDIIPFCEENKIKVIAYEPLEKGAAARVGLKEALSYIMKRTVPIPKSSNKAHIDEIVNAVSGHS